jgi:hypothetical protein
MEASLGVQFLYTFCTHCPYVRMLISIYLLYALPISRSSYSTVVQFHVSGSTDVRRPKKPEKTLQSAEDNRNSMFTKMMVKSKTLGKE